MAQVTDAGASLSGVLSDSSAAHKLIQVPNRVKLSIIVPCYNEEKNS